jgi:hypothetical protein
LTVLVTGGATSQSLLHEVDFTLDGTQETETFLNWLVNNIKARE